MVTCYKIINGLLDIPFDSFLANVNSSSCSLYVIGRPSVVCPSVTLVHPTQAIEIFGNISTPCGSLVIHELCIKILRRSSQGNPSVGGVKQKRGSQNIAILDLSNAISRKRCKIGAKFVLITNRKSHMGFPLAPNSVTLDDLERRNIHIRIVISPNSVALNADYVKVVEDTPILTAGEM